MSERILQQGAEAKIILSNNLIIKDRIKKSYRLKELDEKIRKNRTKKETKLLEKASQIINAPKPFFTRDFYQIKMPYIQGQKLSESLDLFSLEKQKEICKKIGEEIAKLHELDIIHGDLTTSNMILTNKNNKMNSELKRGDNYSQNFQIFFIDFGLGYISKKIEDKAVDLHLLKQALEARHFKNWGVLFNEVLKGYEDYEESKKVFERLKAVEKRGRYKH
jgi:TP53 regulating kinase-like protein